MKKISLLLLLFPLFVFSQSSNKSKKKHVQINDFVFIIDSFSIIPNSLTISDTNFNQIDPSSYLLNEIDAKIRILDSTLLNNILIFEYKIYPVLLSKNYYRRKLNFIDPPNISSWKTNKKRNDFTNDLSRNGEISRIAMIGNNQDLSLISNVDLRIAGKLNNNLNIEAVISDNNLPFQEDGNSYQLQEFDKVYIKIYDKNNQFISGDLEINHVDKYLKYRKKTKGVIFYSQNQYNTFKLSNQISFNMSKGKYTTNSFLGIEGNQGPYKLIGNNNETYIVILSGSERVFIDGERLKRGNENDYIIDYNTAEIIFTNQQFITKDKRIYIEFEYNDRSYAQSVISSINHFNNNRIDFHLNLYSENDWKNQSYLTDLSDENKLSLLESGDNTNNIFSNSIDSISFSENKILYKKVDTMIQNFNIVYYKFSVNPDSAHYEIRFTKVNENEGSYVLDNEEVNGRIYKWVPPIIINNEVIPQGNYSPNIQIISPKSKTIISTSLDYKLSDKCLLRTNIAFENNDENLFSNLDDDDNNSIAGSIDLEYNLFNATKWNLKMINSIEYISAKFEGINRFQDVEFKRNWNINSESNSHILMASHLIISSDENNIIELGVKNLLKGNDYSGVKNMFNLTLKKNTLNVASSTNYSIITKSNLKSILLQSENSIKNNFNQFSFALGVKTESILNYNSFNSLNQGSESFTHLSSEIKNNSEKISINLISRQDKKVENGLMNKFSLANEIHINLSILNKDNLKYKSRLVYRKLHYFPDSLSKDHNILNSNNINIKMLKKIIHLNIDYDLGKGKESKQEKSFIKVPIGMGTHTWVDNNHNNIQELDEFIIAVFQDQAEYVSLYLPSLELEDIYILDYSHNINADLNKISNNKYLKKVNLSSSLRLKNKSRVNESIYNPFSIQNIDSSINYLFQHLNIFSYNKSNDAFNLQFINKYSTNQNSFSYGIDNQKINENNIISNILLYKLISSNCKIIVGEKKNTSNFFETKNFGYKYKKIEEIISFNKSEKSKLEIYYTYKLKESTSVEKEKMRLNQISLLYKQKGDKNYKIEYEIKFVNIKFVKTDNEVFNYELMEGFNNGKNLVWGIKYNKRLKNNIIIDLGYSGRKSENIPIKHIGNLGIQAHF